MLDRESVFPLLNPANYLGFSPEHALARGGGPRYREGTMRVAGREHWKTHRLLLPLSSDGKAIDVLMGGAIFLIGDRINEFPAEPWSYARAVNDPPMSF